MGLLRILLIAIAILACCLFILPKNSKENFLTNKTLKIIMIICAGLIITLSGSIYYFKDTLWKELDNTPLILKKVQVNDDKKSKTLELSSYDLQNFSKTLILSVLNNQPQINTLLLKDLRIEDKNHMENSAVIENIKYILLKNTTLKSLIIKNSSPNVIIIIIDLLLQDKNIQNFILDRNKLTSNTAVLEHLTNMLIHNQNINTIAVKHAALDNNQIIPIINLITAKTKITNLSLQGNQFDSASLEQLAKALQQNNTLQILKINAGIPAETNKQLLLQGSTNSKLIIDFSK